MSNLCWIRRDLRLHDHAALSKALLNGETTIVFIFDTNILKKLNNPSDIRITFIYQSLLELEKEVQKVGSSIIIKYGDPIEEIPRLAKELHVQRVYCNRDYEPYAKERDLQVEKKLTSSGVEFELFKDHVFYERHEIKTHQGDIYKVFTPYKKKWLEQFENDEKVLPDFKCHLKNLRKFINTESILDLNWYERIKFRETLPTYSGGTRAARKRMKNFKDKIDAYAEDRNYPAKDGCSHLSFYIRFGNISIREMIRLGISFNSRGGKAWVSELIWREFYQMILDVYPHVEKSPFKKEYSKIQWQGSPSHFKKWCEGRTGFPIVDAAMRCLNSTGVMHNRLRMIVASFLCKTLLINWQKGEKYFASKLLDYDLAANNGGWQWCSSSGCDAQPYFRIFNPYIQSQKFDPKGEFIRKWLPEIAHLSDKEIHRPLSGSAPDYLKPIVSYELNRQRALSMYAIIKMPEGLNPARGQIRQKKA